MWTVFKASAWITGLAAVIPASSVAAQQETQQSPENFRQGEIVVIGERQRDLFAGLVAESEFDENEIAAYGFDTIGDLLDQIASEVDISGQGPVVLINGQLTNGIMDIADLPSEAVSKIQILPSIVAARLGQSPTQRVINIVIKPDLVQVTTNAKGELTTRGDVFRGEGELNLLKLENNNRRSLVLRVQRGDPLFESQRQILPDTSGIPFSTSGNVVGAGGNGEIDPALSLLVGRPVIIAGVPIGVSQPGLAQFAATAGLANPTDTAPFRSLIDERDQYSANANLTQRYNRTTALSLSGRVEHTTTSGLSGLSSSLFTLPATSPFSPFGRDVLVAVALGEPLTRRQESTAVNLGVTLTSQIGQFSLTASTALIHRITNTETDRDYDLSLIGAGLLAGTINPFTPFAVEQLGPLRPDRARSRSDNGQAQLIATGPLFRLPAGPVRLTARVDTRLDRFTSSTNGIATASSARLSRDQLGGQLNLQVPLLPLGGIAIGDLVADFTGEVRDVTDAGTIHTYGAGLSWQVDRRLSLRGSYTDEEVPPFAGLLTDPVVVTENFRIFDYLREETVLVRFVSGGNRDLVTPQRRITRLSATLRPFDSINLNINAEYVNVVGLNAIAPLPPANAEVQAAFPDRYIRNANGTLVQLDARPVSYARDRSEELRWGIDLARVFGGPQGGSTGEEDGPAVPSLGQGVRVAFRADHTWYLEKSRLAREGLPVIDLLSGGALGFGGGQPRHQVQLSSAIYHRGIGLQISESWTGESLVNSGTLAAPSTIRFKGRTTVDARTFANLGPLFPDTPALKGMRISLAVSNLLDSKQVVVDQAGTTPRNFQPFLLDPLGRSVSLSLRKVF
ncbi:hypothetical protein ACXYL9_12910 [Qipengyuania sp. CAU 1752]